MSFKMCQFNGLCDSKDFVDLINWATNAKGNVDLTGLQEAYVEAEKVFFFPAFNDRLDLTRRCREIWVNFTESWNFDRFIKTLPYFGVFLSILKANNWNRFPHCGKADVLSSISGVIIILVLTVTFDAGKGATNLSWTLHQLSLENETTRVVDQSHWLITYLYIQFWLFFTLMSIREFEILNSKVNKPGFSFHQNIYDKNPEGNVATT